jgi:hypothetical protein
MTLALAPGDKPRTGGSLGDYEQMTAQVATSADQHTRVREVDNPALREALGQFDRLQTDPLGALCSLRSVTGPTMTYLLDQRTASFELVSFCTEEQSAIALTTAVVARAAGGSSETEHTGRHDAVTVVKEIAARLGVPVRDVLLASGISRSTYYYWAKATTALRPRLASQGKLWALVQAVEGLASLFGDQLHGWLLADPARVELLRRGDVDALLSAALDAGVAIPSETLDRLNLQSPSDPEALKRFRARYPVPFTHDEDGNRLTAVESIATADVVEAEEDELVLIELDD